MVTAFIVVGVVIAMAVVTLVAVWALHKVGQKATGRGK